MEKNHEIYQISLKIILRKGNKILFLKSASGKYIDLPGGRIDRFEDKVRIREVLAREIKEELGNDLKYKLGNPILHYRRFRDQKPPIFFVVYDASYLSGDVKISQEHSGYFWIDFKKEFPSRKKFRGVEEYAVLKGYFK